MYFFILNKSFYIIIINDHQCDLFFEDLLELNDIVYSNQKKNKIKNKNKIFLLPKCNLMTILNRSN